MWTIFCCLNVGIVTSTFHLEHIVKLNVGIACFTPKSQYTFCDLPLDITMDITLHMKFTILMWILHQIFVLLKIYTRIILKSCNMSQRKQN